MDWTVAQNLGLPGVMLLVIFAIAKMWIASSERRDMERIKVEDKRADGMVAALTSLNGKVDAHHTLDIQSHAAIGTGIAELRGKVDEAISATRRTPAEGIPYSRLPRPNTNKPDR